VSNIKMSKSFIGGAVVRIGGAGGRRNVRRYVRPFSSCKLFSFQICVESGNGSGTFRNWGDKVQTAVILNALDWKLILFRKLGCERTK